MSKMSKSKPNTNETMIEICPNCGRIINSSDYLYGNWFAWRGYGALSGQFTCTKCQYFGLPIEIKASQISRFRPADGDTSRTAILVNPENKKTVWLDRILLVFYAVPFVFLTLTIVQSFGTIGWSVAFWIIGILAVLYALTHKFRAPETAVAVVKKVPKKTLNQQIDRYIKTWISPYTRFIAPILVVAFATSALNQTDAGHLLCFAIFGWMGWVGQKSGKPWIDVGFGGTINGLAVSTASLSGDILFNPDNFHLYRQHDGLFDAFMFFTVIVIVALMFSAAMLIGYFACRTLRGAHD